MKHPLFKAFGKLTGNPRACVYTEPLWGLSIMLCLPFASLYMSALGLTGTAIGLIASIYMLMQVLFAFLSGAIIDKMGRRMATVVFDFIAWCIPCLFWAFAQNFWYFFVAALFNGTMKITTNSWDCLLAEDAPKDQITLIYSWITIFGQASALFAPIALLLVNRFSLVPAMRVLYINAFVVMTAKVVLLFFMSKETQTGLQRKKETRGQSLWQLLGRYRGTLQVILGSHGTLFALAISALVGIIAMVNNTFWQILANYKIGVPEAALPLFTMLRSVLAIVFFFTIISRMSHRSLKAPLVLGFGAYFAGQGLLLLVPAGAGAGGYILLCVSVCFDAFGAGILAMLAESLVALHASPALRAQILGLLQMTIMLVSAPFGWLAGLLSDHSYGLPFFMNLGLVLLGLVVTLLFYPERRPSQPAAKSEEGAAIIAAELVMDKD